MPVDRGPQAAGVSLATGGSLADENARLYEEAQRQHRWLQASGEVATSLLSGTDPRQVLAATTARCTSCPAPTSWWWPSPRTAGAASRSPRPWATAPTASLGLVLPADRSLAGQVLATGTPVTVSDYLATRGGRGGPGPMGHIGPTMIFPLGAPGNVLGVLSVGRRRGGPPFTPATADVIASFAAQAGVALELAARRSDAERLSLYEDRDRIARDLHDLVIQRLYATGMALEGTVSMIVVPEVADRVRNAVDAMDETIKDIRATIFALQARADSPAARLRPDIVGIVDEMAAMLGFAPSLRLGHGLDHAVGPETSEYLLTALREALSNTARHAKATKVEVSVEVDQSDQPRAAGHRQRDRDPGWRAPQRAAQSGPERASWAAC